LSARKADVACDEDLVHIHPHPANKKLHESLLAAHGAHS
jgi:hypothetical protein